MGTWGKRKSHFLRIKICVNDKLMHISPGFCLFVCLFVLAFFVIVVLLLFCSFLCNIFWIPSCIPRSNVNLCVSKLLIYLLPV